MGSLNLLSGKFFKNHLHCCVIVLWCRVRMVDPEGNKENEPDYDNLHSDSDEDGEIHWRDESESKYFFLFFYLSIGHGTIFALILNVRIGCDHSPSKHSKFSEYNPTQKRSSPLRVWLFGTSPVVYLDLLELPPLWWWQPLAPIQ